MWFHWKTKFKVGLYLQTQFLWKFDISLGDLDFHSRSQFERLKALASIFSEIWQLIPMKFSMLPQAYVFFLKLMLNSLYTSTDWRRELSGHDFMKYMIYIILHQDTCEPMFFKFGTMLGMTKVYSFIPVWTTLMFTQGHRVMGKLELVQSFCCKIAWSNSNNDGWTYKGLQCEEVLYGENGLFEHLLCLFFCVT